MILVKGGRIVDPKSGADETRDLVIDGSLIGRIGEPCSSGGFEQVIDARGKIVAPGLIDIHAHFRDPGLTHKEDIPSGSAAAARGGFTTVVCMANTSPPVDCPEILREVLEKSARSPINVMTVAAVSKGLKGKEITDMRTLKALGAAGFSDDGIALTDIRFTRDAMLAAKELDAVLSLHEEEPSLIVSPGFNGPGEAPCLSERIMVARDCLLALDTGAQVHFQHLSCAGSVTLVKLAKSMGARVTAEATPHHFSLTEDAASRHGSLAKVNPPLRSEADRLAIIAGLKEGVIDIIATDHAPHSAEEKQKGLTDAPSGMTGLETALALGITNLVREGHLSLISLIEKMSLAPALLYGIDRGYLEEGSAADIVIFDENESWTVKEFASKSSNSPFVGERLFGKVKYTICGGKIVYRG